jgi:hypothetical protein
MAATRGLLLFRSVFLPGHAVSMESLTEAVQQYLALRELREHWTSDDGHAAYRFRVEDGKWIAARTDDGRELVAASSFELRVTVANDYAENPVSRGDQPDECA